MPDPRQYPHGSQYLGASDLRTTPTEADVVETYDATSFARTAISVRDLAAGLGVTRAVRRRFTIAEVNAGANLLPAIAGYNYRLVAARAIAIGGAAGAVTTVDLIGTLSSARKLVAYAQVSLTQSTVLRDGDSGAAVLADGASYTANDAGTAITVGKTGADITTATHVDFLVEYAIGRG